MHHWLIAHAHPRQLREYWKWMQERKYVREGPLLKGYGRPMISEVKMLDIRLPADVTDAFIEDLKVHGGGNLEPSGLSHGSLKKGSSEHITLGNFAQKSLQWFRRLPFIPFRPLDKFLKGYSNTDLKENPKRFDGWIQVKYLGGGPDPFRDGKELL